MYTIDKNDNVVYNREVNFKRKEYMNKVIRDTFLKEQDYYRGISNDEYTVNQMAASATRAQYGISKEKLIQVLQGSEENK